MNRPLRANRRGQMRETWFDGVTARVERDTVSARGDRITTMVVRFPRYLQAEVNTHRKFSRSSGSSRAVPVKKLYKMIEENAEKVNLIIGKFQPFNNGHLKMAMRAKKENGYPSVICVYRPSKTNKKYPFSHDTLEKMMSGVKEEYPDLIKEYYFIGRDFLDEAFERLSENYYPVSICVGEKNYSNLT
jgi:hypothetical protein